MLNVCVGHLFPRNMNKANLSILDAHLLLSNSTQQSVEYAPIMLSTPGLETNTLTEITLVMTWAEQRSVDAR